MIDLPHKLHELLTLALADLEAVEQKPEYRIDMSDWHRYNTSNNLCYVCFAGAVMAQTLDTPSTRTFMPVDCGMTNRRKLLSLDSARIGEWQRALDEFYGRGRLHLAPVNMPKPPIYEHDRDGFFAAMVEAAHILKEHNL